MGDFTVPVAAAAVAPCFDNQCIIKANHFGAGSLSFILTIIPLLVDLVEQSNNQITWWGSIQRRGPFVRPGGGGAVWRNLTNHYLWVSQYIYML